MHTLLCHPSNTCILVYIPTPTLAAWYTQKQGDSVCTRHPSVCEDSRAHNTLAQRCTSACLLAMHILVHSCQWWAQGSEGLHLVCVPRQVARVAEASVPSRP